MAPQRSETPDADGIELVSSSIPTGIANESQDLAAAPSSMGSVTDLATDDGPDPSTSEAKKKFRTFAALSGLFSTLFISALNATIVATAIPTISNDLKSASGYAWIGGAYILANTTSAPIWVKLSDIFGRKSILLSAVGLYFAATILCAVSISMKMLIASRALQGIAGGGLIQLVFVIVSDLYSLRERSLYIGYLEVMWAIAGGTGPVLGGFFTQHINWRWIFWISLPISGTSFILLFFFLRVHNPRTPLRRGLTAVDWYGSAAMLGLMTMLLLGLDFGGTTFAWDSPTVVGLIVAGSLMMVVFIMVEKRLAKYPLMPLDIFSVRSNVACLAVGFFHEFCVVSLEYYLPLFFQTALGRSPLLSGALSAPLSFVTGVSGILTGLIIHRSGRYLELIWVGSALLLVGCGLLMLLSAKSSVGSIIGFEMIIGIGAGLNFEPPILALQAHLPQDAVGTATSTANFIRNIAACLAIVIGGVVFQNTIGEHATALQAAGVPSNLVTSLTGNTAAANIGLISTIQDAKQRLVVHQAFADSVKGIWIMCIAMAAALTLSGLLVDKKHLSSEHEETKTGIKHD